MKNFSGIFEDSIEIRSIYSRAACLYKIFPKGVFFPKEEEDFFSMLSFANSRGLPITMRGGGSGLVGGSVGSGIIVDHSRFLKSMELKEKFEAVVSMGVVLSELQRFLNKHNLFFPPDPSSSDFCTIGGMLGNNSKGARSIKYGSTLKNINWVEIMLFDGEKIKIENKFLAPSDFPHKSLKKVANIIYCNKEKILRAFPKSKTNTSGYNLKDCIGKDGKINLLPLFVGSEGTLGIFLKASLKLRKIPKGRSLIIGEFQSLEDAVEATVKIAKLNPSALEIFDKSFIEIVRNDKSITFPFEISYGCESILIIETDGDDFDEADSQMREIIDAIQIKNYKMAKNPMEKNQIWAFRKSLSPLINRGRGKKKSIRIIEDGAVPIDKIPEYIKRVKEILREEEIEAVIFGHAGDGNLHINPFMDLTYDKHFFAVERIIEKTSYLLKELDGTLAGEHGDGRVRAPYLKIIYDDLMDIFIKIKKELDPNSIFNPDVKVSENPKGVTENFRFTPTYKRFPLKGELSKEEWVIEIERCHGCGTCRDFCPTAKATSYDQFSSRGRANLLQAIVEGSLSDDVLTSSTGLSVFESCLSCKECLMHCPTKVDISPIATFVLKNYSNPINEAKNRIFSSFSSIQYKIPSFLLKSGNFFLKNGFLRFITEKAFGFRKDFNIDIESSSFAFDPQKLYFFKGEKGKVILYYGCFGNIFNKDGETLTALNILKKLGVEVVVPPQACCGISKLSRGLLDSAVDDIIFTQNNFKRYIENGYKVVYTAPSCGMAIINEHPQFFPSLNSDILSKNTIYLSQFLIELLKENRDILKELKSSFIYQTPCHSMVYKCDEADIKLLSLIPSLEFKGKTKSCCGLSGTYGLKKENLAISEYLSKSLKEEIESLNGEYIVTPCGSCKIQVEQLTQKRVVHPLKLLEKSLI